MEPPPHLVFQFQNLPGFNLMNLTATNVGGYKDSEMRAYLTGNFLTGLKAAGVPASLLWAPSRRVSKGNIPEGGVDTINDMLWLPTEWEMFGSNVKSSTASETSTNQGRLEYYPAGSGGDLKRTKYFISAGASGNMFYWLASPDSGGTADFCYVDDGYYPGGIGLEYNNPNSSRTGASAVGGCAPAFCVK